LVSGFFKKIPANVLSLGGNQHGADYHFITLSDTLTEKIPLHRWRQAGKEKRITVQKLGLCHTFSIRLW
jgi:hypothetical protein